MRRKIGNEARANNGSVPLVSSLDLVSDYRLKIVALFNYKIYLVFGPFYVSSISFYFSLIN